MSRKEIVIKAIDRLKREIKYYDSSIEDDHKAIENLLSLKKRSEAENDPTLFTEEHAYKLKYRYSSVQENIAAKDEAERILINSQDELREIEESNRYLSQAHYKTE
ncbi:hypothetical protein EDEG_03499 [Edhazardia aedis USNM 41457]|uniref:Uncharacterized protein n=1 Tax=Edhazardia aedis (strain USNM 41457) TaxID=1003232 RepID=J9D3D4_EDHAE|nr:hypothetical protein EDEG_03499 [Edhazardia aedis USNM 41457]|eukprot:EJW02049.1 hypothetical protein EDEG_03499 [Edhazardia aedis USNM 41457]